MLNILNLETVINKNGQLQTSFEFFNNSNEAESEHTLNHKQSLPVLSKLSKITENSLENEKKETLKNEAINDPYQPKVYKTN